MLWIVRQFQLGRYLFSDILLFPNMSSTSLLFVLPFGHYIMYITDSVVLWSEKVVSGKYGGKREMPNGQEVLCKPDRELYHLPPPTSTLDHPLESHRPRYRPTRVTNPLSSVPTEDSCFDLQLLYRGIKILVNIVYSVL